MALAMGLKGTDMTTNELFIRYLLSAELDRIEQIIVAADKGDDDAFGEATRRLDRVEAIVADAFIVADATGRGCGTGRGTGTSVGVVVD